MVREFNDTARRASPAFIRTAFDQMSAAAQLARGCRNLHESLRTAWIGFRYRLSSTLQCNQGEPRCKTRGPLVSHPANMSRFQRSMASKGFSGPILRIGRPLRPVIREFGHLVPQPLPFTVSQSLLPFLYNSRNPNLKRLETIKLQQALCCCSTSVHATDPVTSYVPAPELTGRRGTLE